MKYNKSIKITILCLIIAMIFNLGIVTNTVKAASFSVSASKSSVTVGDTFTVTINGTGLTGKYSITGNANVSLSGETNPWIENTTATITCTAKSEGTATITVTPVTVADSATGADQSLSAKSANVTVKAKETTTPSTPNTPSTPSTPSTPAVTEPTFTSASKTVYATGDINLRSSWSTSSSATSVKKGTELHLTGTSTQTVNGYVWYRVTYNGQIKYVSKSLVTETNPNPTEETPAETKSSVADLKSLKIGSAELTPNFEVNTTEYSVKLQNYAEKTIEVVAEAADEKATVTVEGNDNIQVGENVVTVKVVAEDGTTKIYTVTVVNEDTEALGLASLTIKDIDLDFNSSVLEYKIDFKDLDKLEIEAVANREDATVEILGNENLAEGENVIKILVTSADGEETAVYEITANKLTTSVQEEAKTFNMKAILITALIAFIVLVIIIILIIKFVKQNNLPVVDYQYNDNLSKKDKEEDIKIDNKNDTEFAKDITPEKEEKIDDYSSDFEENDTPRKRGGKHSK